MYYQSYYSQTQQPQQQQQQQPQPQPPAPPPPPPPPPQPQHHQPQPQPYQHQHQQLPPYHTTRDHHHAYRPAYSSYYRPAPAQNRSSHNLNYSRDFERYPTPPHAYNSVPTGAYPFYDSTNQQRWRQNTTTTRAHPTYRRTPAFHFHDKSTYYYMSDPIITNDNRITIQLTKVRVGHNGDQQRVFVEQEFSDENELKKFVKNLRQNFEKTFNNRATGVHSSNENIDENQNTNNKKSGVIVVEEPDEEPKVYEQQAYNENIESKQSTNGESPIDNSPKLDKREQYQRSPLESSCSTIRTSRRRRNRMRYHREKFDNEINKEEKEHPHEKIPSYSRQYELPPRLQPRVYPKEKDVRIRNDFSVPPNLNSHWRFNGYSHSLNSRSRSYIPAMNENFPPPTPSRFQYNKDPFFRPIHPPTPPRFTHSKNPHKSVPSPRFHHTSQHRRNQPITIAEHFIFMNNEQQQPRVHRTRSDCRPKGPFRSRSKTYQYLDYGTNFNQRQYPPFVQPPTPMYYPQRRFFRNTQKQTCLFNSYRPNSKRF